MYIQQLYFLTEDFEPSEIQLFEWFLPQSFVPKISKNIALQI